MSFPTTTTVTAITNQPYPLFGGALTADLPPNLLDASTVRPVPSTQEVFLSTSPLHPYPLSLIIDLCQSVSPPSPGGSGGGGGITPDTLLLPGPTSTSDASDLSATLTHFHELATSDPRPTVTSRVISVERLSPERLAVAGCTPHPVSAYLLTGTVAPPPGASEGYVAIAMLLVRLPHVRTDLVVTVNCTMSGDEGEERVCHPTTVGLGREALAQVYVPGGILMEEGEAEGGMYRRHAVATTTTAGDADVEMVNGNGGGGLEQTVGMAETQWDEAIKLLGRVARSLVVRDWGLFCEDGEEDED